MSDRQTEITNGQVIAMGGGAAGLGAAIVALVQRKSYDHGDLGRDQAHEVLDQVWQTGATARDEIAEAINHVKSSSFPAVGRALDSTKTSSRQHVAKTGGRASDIARQFGKGQSGHLTESAGSAMETLQSTSTKFAKNTTRKGSDMKGRTENIGHRLAEQGATASRSLRDGAGDVAGGGADFARDLAESGRELVRGVGTSIVDTARDRAPKVGQRVSDDVVPGLRDLAAQAAATALDLWDATRQRAVDTADLAQDEFAPRAAHALSSGADTVKGFSSAAAERALDASALLKERASDAGARARDSSRHVATATVDSGKDTGAFLLWAGIAGSVVYYALLSPEQRAQVRKVATTILDQGREIAKDIQGADRNS
jgi:hypothetical protein